MLKVIFRGNLGDDPSIRYTPSGALVGTFSVAINRKWKKDGELREEVTWLRVTTWGKLGEACKQYLHKGSSVLVTGRLIVDPKSGGPRVFQRQDGSYGASFEVSAEEVEFLTPGNGGGGAEAAPAVEEADIPF